MAGIEIETNRGRTFMSTYLIEQLRESLPYLKDQGWTNVAELVNSAANELEQLTLKTRNLEKRQRLSNTNQETLGPQS